MFRMFYLSKSFQSNHKGVGSWVLNGPGFSKYMANYITLELTLLIASGERSWIFDQICISYFPLVVRSDFRKLFSSFALAQYISSHCWFHELGMVPLFCHTVLFKTNCIPFSFLISFHFHAWWWAGKQQALLGRQDSQLPSLDLALPAGDLVTNHSFHDVPCVKKYTVYSFNSL